MKNNINDGMLVSGKTSFIIDVPYKLFETEKKGAEKPLILYLHGFKDNIETYKEKCSLIVQNIEAYHLFIRGPYPLYESRSGKNIEDWGAAWYLYDGNQDQFISSLEKTSCFIDKVLQNLKDTICYERLCLLGYSMGGYLAGYYTMTRPAFVNDLIVIGSRIKTEVLTKKWEELSHLNVLALHGKRDKLVDYKPQRSEITRLSEKGVKADFKLIDQTHILNDEFMGLIYDWLYKNYY